MVSLPSGRLSAPIVIRVESPSQGEALLARIAVELGAGASAAISEEVIGADIGVAPRSGATASALLATSASTSSS
mgnify:CR=1 FL=1